MKYLKSIVVILTVLFFALSISAQTKKIDVTKSTINWVGKKVTGQHNGTINLKDGNLIFKAKKVTGGNFTVDMTSLTATDLIAGKGKEKLDAHLKSDDFFSTEKFPTATLVFKAVVQKAPNLYSVTGNLTIKGITNSITFDLKTTINGASSAFEVDRTNYDIKYSSGSFIENLGDKVIADNFDLTVALKF